MALITLHLFNSIDKQEEVIINSDHIVSAQAANENSTNIQLTSGPTFRVTESVGELYTLTALPGAAPLSAPETKSKKSATTE